MERLTQLGTVTSSRVVVEKLVIEQEKLAAVISLKTRLQPRSVPAQRRYVINHAYVLTYCSFSYYLGERSLWNITSQLH